MIRSPRSLYRVRNVVTVNGMLTAVTRTIPRNGSGIPGKISVRYFEICPYSGTLIVAFRRVAVPSALNNSKATSAPPDPDRLVTAIPVWIVFNCPGSPVVSTYVRSAHVNGWP